ncbi:MAG TPA: LuxR C-terminal-related transcriptional regulator [Candidatus Dormibacteraeota bacterium]|nr:LuxR C-terminal-related transcriptional regulator [Candidatus Dormibacteraeota bacterium]
MTRQHGGAPALTARELEVASLIAEGLTDQAIAKRLFRSVRTVESHVLQIRSKLGFENRTQIATWVARRAAGLEDAGDARPPAPNNLPAPVTSFVGRHGELQEVRGLLRATRLLSLVGPGGCGKTRLALEVAAGLLRHYAAGAWFVDLSPLRDVERVPAEVAVRLGAQRLDDEHPLAAILAVLGADQSARRRLLVIDNCEHLLEGCGPLAEGLLQGCPQLTVLATTREPLHVAGEVVWRLGPLTLPGAPPISEPVARESDAVRLFVERAALASPGFRLGGDDVEAIVDVVRRLDGIPLALELAAGHLGTMTVEQLRRHLDEHFVLAGRRGLVSRQRTMAATIQWSYELLDEAERRLHRRLSVISGTFTLEAAAAVAALDGPAATLGPLSALVDKSLVVAAPGGTGRYRLLETIRGYGLARLDEAGELEDARRRHHGYFLSLAEPAAAALRGPDQLVWLASLDEAHDDLLAALDYGHDHAPENAPRLALALERFWFIRGHLGEGRRRLEAVIDLPDIAPRPRARVLIALATLAWRQGDTAAVRRHIERGLAISRELDDPDGTYVCLTHLGLLAMREHRPERARDLYLRGLELAGLAGNERGVASLRCNLGVAELLLRDHPAAEAHLTAALAMLRTQGDREEIANALNNLGTLELDRGMPARARERYGESLTLLRAVGDDVRVAEGLEGMACVAGAEGRMDRALQLAGAASALRETLGSPAAEEVRVLIQSRLDALRAAAPARAASRAWAAGRALTSDAAIALALAP